MESSAWTLLLEEAGEYVHENTKAWLAEHVPAYTPKWQRTPYHIPDGHDMCEEDNYVAAWDAPKPPVYKGYSRMTHFKEHLRRVGGTTRFSVVLPRQLVEIVRDLDVADPGAIRSIIKMTDDSRLLYRDLVAIAAAAKTAKPTKLTDHDAFLLTSRFAKIEAAFNYHKEDIERKNFPSYYVTLEYLFGVYNIRTDAPLATPQDAAHKKYLLALLEWLDTKCQYAQIYHSGAGMCVNRLPISCESSAPATAAIQPPIITPPYSRPQTPPPSSATSSAKPHDPASTTFACNRRLRSLSAVPPPCLPQWRSTMQRKRFYRAPDSLPESNISGSPEKKRARGRRSRQSTAVLGQVFCFLASLNFSIGLAIRVSGIHIFRVGKEPAAKVAAVEHRPASDETT